MQARTRATRPSQQRRRASPAGAHAHPAAAAAAASMPPATHSLPYKRPFFAMTLSPHEIEEDLALIITNTKRRRRASPPADRHQGRMMDRD